METILFYSQTLPVCAACPSNYGFSIAICWYVQLEFWKQWKHNYSRWLWFIMFLIWWDMCTIFQNNIWHGTT